MEVHPRTSVEPAPGAKPLEYGADYVLGWRRGLSGEYDQLTLSQGRAAVVAGTYFVRGGSRVDEQEVAVKCVNAGEKQASVVEASRLQLHHPNLIRVVGYCVDRSHLVMECGWHGSLGSLLEKARSTSPLHALTAFRILEGVAQAMFTLHQRGLFRLELKEDKVVLGCMCHHPNTFKRCTRPLRDDGHVLIAKVAQKGVQETVLSGEAQRGNEAAPLWMTDVTAFGAILENMLACVTGAAHPVRKRALMLVERCKGGGLQPELICKEMAEMVSELGAPPLTSLLRDYAQSLRLARFGTNQLVDPAKMSFPELWLLSREQTQDKRLLATELKVLLEKDNVRLWVRGPPGYGKSALCKHLAHGWASGTGLLKDEVCVVYVPLGEVIKVVQKQHSGSVVDLELVLWCHWKPLSSALTLDLTLDNVKEFIASRSSTLFIFDSVDEALGAADDLGKCWIKSLVSGQVNGLHRVLLCGRADGALAAGGLQMEVAGLSDQMGFVKRQLEGGEDAVARVAFMSELLTRPSFADFLRSPLTLQLMCALYNGKEKAVVPVTLTALYTRVIEKRISSDVLSILESCDLTKHGVERGLRSLSAEQCSSVLGCGIFTLVGDASFSIADSVEEWELHEWGWYHPSFGDYFAARQLLRSGRECSGQDTESVYSALKPLACSTRLVWQFAMGLLVESDAPSLRAALWRLFFVSLYQEEEELRTVFEAKEFCDWRQFAGECNSLAVPNDRAAGLHCVAVIACAFDPPLAALGKIESALVAARNSAVSSDVVERVVRWSGRYTNGMEQDAEADRLQGYLKESLALFECLAAFYERTLGKEHPSYAIALHQMALVRMDQGDLPRALELFHTALAIKDGPAGRDGSYTATLRCIAQVHKVQGNLKRALDMYRRSLAIDRTMKVIFNLFFFMG
jgi:hypothetical protein